MFESRTHRNVYWKSIDYRISTHFYTRKCKDGYFFCVAKSGKSPGSHKGPGTFLLEENAVLCLVMITYTDDLQI